MRVRSKAIDNGAGLCADLKCRYMDTIGFGIRDTQKLHLRQGTAHRGRDA